MTDRGDMRLPAAAAFRVLDSMVEGVNVSDAQGTIIYTNPAEDALFGYERGELIGCNIRDLNAGEQAANERLIAGALESLAETGVWTGLWRNIRKNGSVFTTRVRITSIDVEGVPHSVAIHEDVTESLAAEQRLIGSERRFRTLFEHAADGLVITSPDGRILEVNQSGCAYIGYTREELLQKRTAEVFARESLPDLEAARTAVDRDGSYRGQFQLVRKDGSRLPVDASIQILEDGRRLAMLRDASERIRVEEELRAANKTLQAIIETSPLPIVTLTADGAITLWNPAAEKLFGWKAEEVLGKPIPFIPAEKRQEHLSMRKADLSGDAIMARVIRRVRRDGTPIDVSVSTAPIRDYTGRVTGIMSLYADVTEQKHAEAALIESETRFRDMADAAPVMLWIATNDGRKMWVNRPWLDFRGRTFEEEIGDGWQQALHPDDACRALSIYSVAFQSETAFQMEFRLERRDGSFRWMFENGVPRYESDGTFIGFIGSCIDIHDRKVAEQEREAALNALSRTNEELKQFAYVASHDLQEPLRTVTAYTQLLMRAYASSFDEKGLTYANYITSAARRMTELIQGLLEYSRLTGDREPRVGPVSMNECVDAAMDNLHHAANQGQLDLECATLPVVNGDRSQLIQLFQNLLSNAIKYRRGDRVHVRIEAERRSGAWLIRVEDDGIGVPPEYSDRIFGLFKRLHGIELPGTGLGLAICKRIAENHGGQIWVEKKAGPGARFWFTIAA